VLDQAVLAGFCGTEEYHRYSPLFRRMLLTDGALYVAESGGRSGAFWLMDAIASHQPRLLRHPDGRLQGIQFWALRKRPDPEGGAVLECCADSGEKPAVRQVIEYTDFFTNGDTEFRLWAAPVDDQGNWVIMLPSEY